MVSVHLRVVTSSTGLHLKRCPGIGFLSRVYGEIGVFWNVARPMRLPLEFLCETSLLLRCDEKVGVPFRQSREIDPHVEIRRGKGAQINWCRETLCSSRVRPVCQGTFWVASRVSSTVSNFKRELGNSLQTLQLERASSRNDWGSSWFFSSFGGILELQQGTPGASRVAPGMSSLHSNARGS